MTSSSSSAAATSSDVLIGQARDVTLTSLNLALSSLNTDKPQPCTPQLCAAATRPADAPTRPLTTTIHQSFDTKPISSPSDADRWVQFSHYVVQSCVHAQLNSDVARMVRPAAVTLTRWDATPVPLQTPLQTTSCKAAVKQSVSSIGASVARNAEFFPEALWFYVRRTS